MRRYVDRSTNVIFRKSMLFAVHPSGNPSPAKIRWNWTQLSHVWMIALSITISIALLVSVGGSERVVIKKHPALASLPTSILWAWERTEDLRWAPSNVGVAYVATAIGLSDDNVALRPRTSPLRVLATTTLIPVVHVDASWYHPPKLNATQRDAIVNQVLLAAERTNAKVVQLDFEARRSQRPFLLEVVRLIRQKLPLERALSVTALASWCARDYWLAELQADEIVPMVFRMSKDDAPIKHMLARRMIFPHERCTSAVGYATDEPMPPIAATRRYYFSPTAWRQDEWARLYQFDKSESRLAMERHVSESH
jgi:hypothetical protein